MNALAPPAVLRSGETETQGFGGVYATRFVDGAVLLSTKMPGLRTTMHLTLAEAREVAAMLREVTA